MRQVSLVRVSAVIGLLAFVATCDDPNSRIPTAPGEPRITGLQVNGPDSIAPGQSAQFSVATRLSDGTTKLATNLANLRWQSSDTSVLQITASGVATAREQVGEATVSVELVGSPGPGLPGRLQSTKEVVVLPDGTYRLVGRVVEVESPDAPVVGARVEVSPGSAVAETDPGGRYQLYGVPPDAEIRVTAAGYRQHVERLSLTAHATRDFRLALSGRRLTLEGRYTLAIDVLDGCPGGQPLSADLQHRRYEALVTQGGANVIVSLTEPRFRLDSSQGGNQFSGRADAAGATFTLRSSGGYYYYYYYYGPGSSSSQVVEKLSNGSFLVLFGTAVTTGSAARLSGDMIGSIWNWDSRFPARNAQLLGSCSGTLQFTLTRR